MKIGVLALQGGVIEHIKHLEALNCEVVEVKTPEHLKELKGIILPGGESTTIGRLLTKTGIEICLKDKISNGLPVWGTCAGMILLAKSIENQKNGYLQVMDISVKRNAFGSQIDSFAVSEKIEEFSCKEIPLVFIRAPYITHADASVRVLARVNNNIIAAREENMLVTSFHPELTESTEVHKYFISMCRQYGEKM